MNAVDREIQDLVRVEADTVIPPEGTKERGWARLQAALANGDGGPDDDGGSGGGGPSSAEAPPLSPAPTLKGVPLLKIVPLAVLLVTGALVVWAVGRRPEVVATRMQVASEPMSSHGAAITIPFVPEPGPVAPPAEPEVPPPDEARGAPAPSPPTPSKPRAAAVKDDFEGELGLLAAGQAAILRGELREGLALLRSHKQRFPRGHFAQERDALIAIARCEGGQTGAPDAGRKFLSINPESIHADRVRTACKL